MKRMEKMSSTPSLIFSVSQTITMWNEVGWERDNLQISPAITWVAKLCKDYFSKGPIYPDHMFSRWFRVSQTIYIDINSKHEAKYNFFKQTKNGIELTGFDVLRKCTQRSMNLSFRFLTYPGFV